MWTQSACRCRWPLARDQHIYLPHRIILHSIIMIVRWRALDVLLRQVVMNPQTNTTVRSFSMALGVTGEVYGNSLSHLQKEPQAMGCCMRQLLVNAVELAPGLPRNAALAVTRFSILLTKRSCCWLPGPEPSAGISAAEAVGLIRRTTLLTSSEQGTLYHNVVGEGVMQVQTHCRTIRCY